MKPALCLLALVLAALVPRPAAAGSGVDPLRTIAVQDGGRVKPLDTFARETAPDRWKAEPIVRVTHAGLGQAVDQEGDRAAVGSSAAALRAQRATEPATGYGDAGLQPAR